MLIKFITVHELAQCQGPHCRAVIKLLASQIQALTFLNSGAKLTVGYQNAQVSSLTCIFFITLFVKLCPKLFSFG